MTDTTKSLSHSTDSRVPLSCYSSYIQSFNPLKQVFHAACWSDINTIIILTSFWAFSTLQIHCLSHSAAEKTYSANTQSNKISCNKDHEWEITCCFLPFFIFLFFFFFFLVFSSSFGSEFRTSTSLKESCKFTNEDAINRNIPTAFISCYRNTNSTHL